MGPPLVTYRWARDTRWTFAPLDPRTALRPATRTTTYVNDSVASSLDTVSYSYDDLDRVATETVQSFSSPLVATPTATVEQYILYDELGRVQNVTNDLDSFIYTYGDITSRITGATSTGGPTETRSYYASNQAQDGLLEQIVYTPQRAQDNVQSATFGYTYNADDQVSGTSFNVSLNGGAAVPQNTTYHYDDYGELSEVDVGNGVTAYVYDENGNSEGNASSL
jgi:hypothetical protein